MAAVRRGDQSHVDPSKKTLQRAGGSDLTGSKVGGSGQYAEGSGTSQPWGSRD